MNNKEAKFVLTAYRPGGRDAGDPVFGAALKQAQDDPALAAWFQRERAHDTAVSSRLAEIMPPAGLKEAILAGSRASRSKKIDWRRFGWPALAAAAALALTWAAAFPVIHTKAEERRLADFVLADVSNDKAHHNESPAAHVLQAVLSDPGTRLAGNLKIDLASLQATGCRTLTFAGKNLVEVCFERDGHWFHLYAIRESDVPDLRRETDPVIATAGAYACASWTSTANGVRFLVATHGDPSALLALL